MPEMSPEINALRALAAMFQDSPAGYMFLASSGIRSAADFRGKRIGIHRYADPLYRWFLDRAGIAASDAPFIFSHDDFATVVRGELDALQGYSIEEYLRFRTLAGKEGAFSLLSHSGFRLLLRAFGHDPGADRASRRCAAALCQGNPAGLVACPAASRRRGRIGRAPGHGHG